MMPDILREGLIVFAGVLIVGLWFLSGAWLAVEVAYARRYPEIVRALGVAVVIATWCALANVLWALAFGHGPS